MGRFISASSLLLVAALAVMFMSCKSESEEPEPEFTANIVKTFDDLPNCSQGKYAIVYYVQEEEQFYYCDGWEYIQLDPPDETCTVVDNGDGTKTVRCDDGTSVTVNDVECVQDPGICEDGDACTTDTCDRAVGCVSVPVDCDDGDLCTVDDCDPVDGSCANEPLCDDGDLCTVDDCDPVDGSCAPPTPVVCPPREACNPDTGICEVQPVCLCFAADALAQSPSTFDTCVDREGTSSGPGLSMFLDGAPNWNAAAFHTYNPYVGDTERFCTVNALDADGNIVRLQAYATPDPGSTSPYLIPIPLRPEDFQLCLDIIEAEAAARGLVCTPL